MLTLALVAVMVGYLRTRGNRSNAELTQTMGRPVKELRRGPVDTDQFFDWLHNKH